MIIDKDILTAILIIGLIFAILLLNIRIDMLHKRVEALQEANLATADVLTIYNNMFKEFRLLMEDIMSDLQEEDDSNASD